MIKILSELENEREALLNSLSKMRSNIEWEKALLCIWTFLFFITTSKLPIGFPLILNTVLISMSLIRGLVLSNKIKKCSFRIVVGNILIRMIRKENINNLVS